MKNLLLLVVAVLATQLSFGQLPNGSVAPDFTLTDIDGVSHHLYDYLDQGKTVVIDVSATWCGPCWGFHTSGVLEDTYAEYGPNGTNEIVVLFIEGDTQTTMADLQGNTAASQGDWLAGTEYPVIDVTNENFNNAYNIGYFPTVYKICPNRIIEELGNDGNITPTYIHNKAQNCPIAVTGSDPALLMYTGDSDFCDEVELKFNLQNNGTEPLTSAVIVATANGSQIASTNWTGNLNTYQVAEVSLGNVSISASTNVDIVITSTNANADNDVLSQTLTPAVSTNTAITVRLKGDSYVADETSFKIVYANTGATVAGTNVALGSIPENVVTTYNYTLEGSLDCYKFVITDEYGDGINYNCPSCFIEVKDSDNTIIFNNVSFGSQGVGFFKAQDDVLYIPMNATTSSSSQWQDTPNGTVSVVVAGGSGTYTYTWTNATGTVVGNTATVTGLAAGTYTVSINDGVATITQTVTVLNALGINNPAAVGFNVYPNPANNAVTITFATAANQVRMIDVTGKVVSTQTLNAGTNQTTVLLDNLANGAYLCQLINNNAVVAVQKLTVIR